MNDDKKDKKELTLADLQNVRGAALAGKKIAHSKGESGQGKHPKSEHNATS